MKRVEKTNWMIDFQQLTELVIPRTDILIYSTLNHPLQPYLSLRLPYHSMQLSNFYITFRHTVRMVEFKPMSRDEFPAYWKYSVDSYKRDMERAGLIEKDTSYEDAEEQLSKFLPDGIDTAGHHLMHIMDGEDEIGTIWFEIRTKGEKEAYLFDVIIGETHRGMGYGRDTIKRLEEFVKREGAARISLSVFGFNAIARNLYVKMGYQDAAITMMKYL